MCELVKKRWVADDNRGVAGIPTRQVIGICAAFTVLPRLADGTPLCEPADVRAQPHAHAELPTHLAAGCWWGSYDAMHGPRSRRQRMLAEPAGSKAISKEAL